MNMSSLSLSAAVLLLASGCSALRPAASPSPPSFYSLTAAPASAEVEHATPSTAPTLLISVPRAAAGFDSQRIVYTRQAYKLEYFAHSEWIDPPARMLSPLLVTALANSGAFRAVVQAPSSASGDLRLDTEILQLQQEFSGGPSQVRFTLRATLVADASRRAIQSRDFEAIAIAASNDPIAGVAAANQAVRNVLVQIAAFCAETAASWRSR